LINSGTEREILIATNEKRIMQPAPDLTGCSFYHTMDLPVLGVVRGNWHIRNFPQYIGSVDLKDKTVLDVGTASGFLSFEAERAGASQVVSFDVDSAERMYRLPFAENLYWMDWPAWVKDKQSLLDGLKKSYRIAHGLLGSKAETCYGDIFHLRTLLPRSFDVTIAGAILEHLNDPVSALASMAMVTRERIIVAFTPIIESEEIMLLAANSMTDPASDFTWWTGSLGMYRRVLENMGFEIERIVPSVAFTEPKGELQTRSTLIARRRNTEVKA
jgi:SAM-dependent methyltransferase